MLQFMKLGVDNNRITGIMEIARKKEGIKEERERDLKAEHFLREQTLNNL